MNEEQDRMDRQVPIPPELYGSESKKPLDHCLMCNLYLLEDGTPYMIEKSIKQHPEMGLKETIFEYAMCMDCAVKMNDSLSVRIPSTHRSVLLPPRKFPRKK